KPLFIKPRPGFRGGHVVATNHTQIAEASGIHSRETFLKAYFFETRTLFKGWDAEIVELETDPAGWEFCRAYGYRHPTQFPHDPVSRAERFVRRWSEA